MRRAAWAVPPRPWALHVTLTLGNLTDRWIDHQVLSGSRFSGRILGWECQGSRQTHWLLAADRTDLRVAFGLMPHTGGKSTAWLATEFRGDRAPSLVHAHYGPVAAGFRHLAHAVGVPLVTSFYGYDATQTKYRERAVWRRRYGRLFESGAAFIIEGPAMGARLEALGCPPEKLHVVRIPVDAAGLGECHRKRAPGFRVVMAGRFSEKKGFDTGIRAFARSLRERPDAELLLVGGGELEGRFRALVNECKLTSKVRWAGRLPFQPFMNEVGTAAVVLFPSRTASDGDSEGGAPVTLAEAQWLGVPAIVSDHDDLPFLAAPGTAVLPPEDVDAWASALEDLYVNAGALDALGRSARAFAQLHHDPLDSMRGRERAYDIALR
jgi:colanic acid/amylovoran biosynthesis glycosyltransferase